MREEYHPVVKTLLISLVRKINLIQYQLSCNHSIQVLFIAVVIVAMPFFFFFASGFIYRYIMLILINGCFLNLIFCMVKALNYRICSEYNFKRLFHLSVLYGKPCFSYCLFSSFLPTFLISNLSIVSPHSSCVP